MADAETSSAATAAPAAQSPRIPSCNELIVLVDHDEKPILHTVEGPCDVCCPWTYAFRPRQQEFAGVIVPMLFNEWLVYHLHVVTHQRLDRSALPA